MKKSGRLPACPKCGVRGKAVRYGRIASGKQRWRCKTCRYQFVRDRSGAVPSRKLTAARELIEDWLLEKRLGLSASRLIDIARRLGVSRTWVQNLANKIRTSEELRLEWARQRMQEEVDRERAKGYWVWWTEEATEVEAEQKQVRHAPRQLRLFPD